MSLPALNLTPLDGVANPKLLGALQKLAGDEPDAMRHGLDELMSLTKRSDYVVECLDLLLKDVMLLERLLACLAPGLEVPGEVAVRGVGLEACSVPMGEAIQLAACSALGAWCPEGGSSLRVKMRGHGSHGGGSKPVQQCSAVLMAPWRPDAGELIWQRDTSSEVRPVLLEKGGMRALATLIAQTPSERVRLKVLVLARRMMYEVGSTSTMDPLAFQVRPCRRAPAHHAAPAGWVAQGSLRAATKGVSQRHRSCSRASTIITGPCVPLPRGARRTFLRQAAKEADLMGAVVGMLSRVVAGGDATVTLDTLEGVVYLLQRMQVSALVGWVGAPSTGPAAAHARRSAAAC